MTIREALPSDRDALLDIWLRSANEMKVSNASVSRLAKREIKAGNIIKKGCRTSRV
jgi:hypothetical protein